MATLMGQLFRVQFDASTASKASNDDRKAFILFAVAK
jgi:hypothetical protein